MNRLFHWMSLVAIAISLVACNNEDVDVPRFQYDANGRCYQPDVKPISHAEFLKYAEGNGWDHVSTYEINLDGSVQEKDYYEDLTGGGPNDIYFKKDSYSYRYYNCEFHVAFSTWKYEYKEGNQIGYTYHLTGEFHTMFQVLSISQNELKVVEPLALRASENRDIYGLVTYRKMTDEERKSYEQAYESYIGQLPPVE